MLRDRFRRIERGLRGELESFPLRDGGRYFFDPGQAHSALFVFSYQVLCGDQPDEPPEILRRVAEAKDVRGALAKLDLDPGSLAAAHGPLHEIVELPTLVRERRIVVLEQEPVADLSEQ